MLVLQNWSGRLGNNIAQMVNIIDIALYFNHNVTFNIKYLYGEAFNNKELQDYYLIMKPWKNTKKQKNKEIIY